MEMLGLFLFFDWLEVFFHFLCGSYLPSPMRYWFPPRINLRCLSATYLWLFCFELHSHRLLLRVALELYSALTRGQRSCWDISTWRVHYFDTSTASQIRYPANTEDSSV